jgi:hypothetical protein
MKKIFLLFLLFLGGVAINAQTYMHVYHTSGINTYDTDFVPVMTFTTTDVVVDDNGTAAPYVMDDVSKIIFDALNSVDEESTASTVGIFPNPTTGFITLKINNNEATEFVVDIFNVTGAIVSTNTYPSNGGVLNERVDLSSYVDGIYMIRINSGNDIVTQKIMKK